MTATTAPVTALPTVAASHLERASALASRGQRTLLGLVGGARRGQIHAGRSVAAPPGQPGTGRAHGRLPPGQPRAAPGWPPPAQRRTIRLTAQALPPCCAACASRARTAAKWNSSAFTRDLDEPVAGAIPIFADTPLVIVEGNYLLLEEGHWRDMAPPLTRCGTWTHPVQRTQQLIARHVQFGRTPQAAADWAAQTDEPNAVRIAATCHRAHRIFRWDDAVLKD